MKIVVSDPEIRQAVAAWLEARGVPTTGPDLKLVPQYDDPHERGVSAITFEADIYDIKPVKK